VSKSLRPKEPAGEPGSIPSGVEPSLSRLDCALTLYANKATKNKIAEHRKIFECELLSLAIFFIMAFSSKCETLTNKLETKTYLDCEQKI
jgi:hypothetical protein